MGSVDCDWLGQVQWRFVFVYYESNNMWGVLTDWLCQVRWHWWRVLTVLTDCTVTPMGCVDWLTVPGTMTLMESVDCFDWLYSDPDGVCWLTDWLCQVQWPWWRVLTVLTDCTVTPMGCVDWLYSDPDGECWLFWLTVQWPRWGVLTDWLCQVQWSWWRVLTVLTDCTVTMMGCVDWLTDCARYNDPDGGCWLFWLPVQWPWWGVLTDWLCQVQWSWWRVLTVLTDSTMTLMGNVDCFDWLWPGTMTLIGKADCLTDYDGESWVWALTVARCDKTLMRSVDCLTDCGQVQWSAGGEHEAGSEEESGYRSGHWLHHVLHVWFLWAGLLVSLFPASAVFTLHMAQEDEADESEISFISWCGKKYVRVR